MEKNRKILTLSREELMSGGKIPVDIYENEEVLFKSIARLVADEIKENTKNGREALFILPLGPVGQYGYLADIINEERISLKTLTVINMDEYMDDDHTLIGKDDDLSFEKTMYKLFYDKVDPELLNDKSQRIFPDLENGGYIRELIEKHGGVDFCLGGIGVDGHVAFNEPIEGMSAEEFANLSVRVVKIRPETKVTNGTMEFGGAYEFIPDYAITIGMKEILAAKKIRLYCFKPWHRMVVRKASFYHPSAEFPVTLLQGKDVRLGIPESLS